MFVRTGEGDPYEGNPPFQLASNIPYVRDGRFGRGAYKPDYNDFAPRLGMAWSVDPKTVVRAGAGIYYVRDIGNAVFDIVRNAPFTIRRNEPAETFRPNLSFEQPFARTGSPTFILAAEYDMPSSYIGQWSLGFQRELPGQISAEVTYFGSTGVHLRRLMTYNNTEPSALANTNLSRPFPDLGGVQLMSAPSHSKYNALYLKMQKRFSHGISFLSSFSYGKSIDNGSGVRTSVGDPLTPSNNYDLELETGPSAFDFRKRWTTSWIWELPFGQDRRYMNQRWRCRLRPRRLAAWRHPDAAGRVPVHAELQHRHRAERRRRMLPGSRTGQPGLAAAGERAQPDPILQHGRVRGSQSGVRHRLPLRNGETEYGRRARHQELRHVVQQELRDRQTTIWSSASKCSTC